MGLPVLLNAAAIQGLVRVSNYYDRSPNIQNFYFANTAVAPHGNTNRITYTVPSNKEAYIEFFNLKSMRRTAATTAGTVNIFMSYFGVQSGITSTPGVTILQTNNVGDQDRSDGGNFGLMVAGDQLFLGDQDASTGGACDYYESAKVTEFNV